MKCKVCDRETQNKYCELHERAHRNIVKKYDDWKRASDVSWKEYLTEVTKNPYTGVWAREVAEHLISETE